MNEQQLNRWTISDIATIANQADPYANNEIKMRCGQLLHVASVYETGTTKLVHDVTDFVSKHVEKCGPCWHRLCAMHGVKD